MSAALELLSPAEAPSRLASILDCPKDVEAIRITALAEYIRACVYQPYFWEADWGPPRAVHTNRIISAARRDLGFLWKDTDQPTFNSEISENEGGALSATDVVRRLGGVGDIVELGGGFWAPGPVRIVQVADGGPGRTASLPDDIAPGDLTAEKALALARAKAEGPRSLGVDPVSELAVYVMNGRFGAYVQLGETPEAPTGPKTKGKAKGQKAENVEKPKRASLQAGMTETTVTLEEALKLLSLPRVVGTHPDDGEPITTNFGRFGPYAKHGDEFRSLESEDDVFNITFDAALALLRAPKQSRRRQAAQKTVLQELEQGTTKLRVLAGRYGPYVTDGTTNASIPKGTAAETLTFEQATELLEARRNAAPSPRRASGRKKAASGRKTKRARKTAGA